jgi:hypothetical protein
LFFFFWPLCCLSFFFWSLCCLFFFFWSLCCLFFFFNSNLSWLKCCYCPLYKNKKRANINFLNVPSNSDITLNMIYVLMSIKIYVSLIINNRLIFGTLIPIIDFD